jgi:hypothetical protein
MNGQQDFNLFSEYQLKMLKQADITFADIFSKEPDRKNITIVAEGDSWFDYPIGVDIIDFLRLYYKYNTVNLSHFGDKLLKMIYGNDKNNKEKNIDFIIETIQKTNAKAFLFSGGGNDIAGEALEIFLHYYKKGMQPKDMVNYTTLIMFFTELKNSLEEFINDISKVSVPILMHGYGYPIPNGNPVLRLFGAIPLVGPWLKPAFENRGIGLDNLNFSIQVMKIIMDEYNNILVQLQNEYPNKFYFVECRDIIAPTDWTNELHVYSNCYKKISDRFFSKLKELNIC